MTFATLGNRVIRAALGRNAAAVLKLPFYGPRRTFRACAAACLTVRDVAPDSLNFIPEVELGEILGDRKPKIQITVSSYENGSLPTADMVAVLSILVAEAPDVALEIGTFMGGTTRQLAENMPGGILHTVDLPEDYHDDRDARDMVKDDLHLIKTRVVARDYKGRPCAERIRQHFGDTATWNFAAAAPANFFFIDGAHTADYCRSDSEKCYELCGGRGVFLWHDCDSTHPGVLQMLNEWIKRGRMIRRIEGTNVAYWKSA